MPEQEQIKVGVVNVNYNLQEAGCVSLAGTEEVFAAIKEMIELLPQGSIYHHFYGFNDQLWDESGLTDRARKEVVPVKVAKQLKTKGLYFPTDWVIKRFGGDIAQREYRNYDLLPEGIEIFSRFYIYRDTVFSIFKDGDEYNGTLVTSKNFAEHHKSLFERMREIPRISPETTIAEVVMPNDVQLIRSVATFALLDCFYDKVNCIKTTEPAKTYMQQVLCNSKGIEVKVECNGKD